jgi:hypothetical protein
MIEMERQGITEEQVRTVLQTPEQSEPAREGRATKEVFDSSVR